MFKARLLCWQGLVRHTGRTAGAPTAGALASTVDIVTNPSLDNPICASNVFPSARDACMAAVSQADAAHKPLQQRKML